MPNFETFSRRMVPLKTDPHVTIQKRGTISLNKSAYLAIGSPDSVELLYDRDARIIGLRKVSGDAENAYHVRASSQSPSGPWVISAMAFTKFYDIDTTTSQRWDAYLDDDVLCVDLRREGTPVTSNRAHRRPVH
jgi:hypothetical protein